MITTTNENSNPLPPAVAAALIQQHSQQQQISHATGNPTNITTQQASTVTESIQQQIVASHQQQAAAAAAVAHHLQHQQQVQHVAQQQAAAQIVAAAQVQQMQQQIAQHQQQQLAALANVAAVHHHQQQQQHLNQQSLNANNAFLTPGSTTNSQNENVNQQLQQVANVFSTGTIQNNNQQPPNISSQIVTPAPSTGILPSCFIEVAAAHLASQPQQTPQQTSIPPPPNPNVLPQLIPQTTTQTGNILIQQPSSIMSIGTGGGQLNNNNNCTPPQQNTSSIQQQQQAITSTNQSQSQNLLQCQQFPTQQQPQQQQPIHPQYLEMVSIPKDILLKLVEQRIESDKTQIQPPSKCLCHCHCGRYPNDVPIVDKVMTDLLEGSSKHLGGGDNNSTSSNNSTPRNSLQSQPVHFQSVTNGQISLQQTQQHQQNTLVNQSITTGNFVETMDTSGASFSIASSLHQLSASDQEQLAELSKANEIWKTSATTSSNISLTAGGAQSGDLQFLMGHYTESDLRRLIGLAKSLDAFKRLDQHDQERLLKSCFGSFFVLRSVLSVEVNEFTVAILRQNGVPESTIRFYVDFPVEWRRNETINLLLGLILLFNVEVADLQSAISVTVENMKFQSLLKRLLYAFCDRDSVKAETVAAELLARVEHLKQLFPGGTPTTHNSLGIGTCNNLAFVPQTIGQQQQIVSTSQLVECSNSSININTRHALIFNAINMTKLNIKNEIQYLSVAY
uniref:NR LBD domain-containing protein n=1 Tax=Meloidogyne incognita TaxID=6306 RepID=A0A914MHV8_MELIC